MKLRTKINLKNANKGITLIALIITIIVLLILAGVVINMTIGNDGIISKAQSSADMYSKAQATETMNLKVTEVQMKYYSEKQRGATLQEMANYLTEDEMVEYVKLGKATASIDVTGYSSILVKLKAYVYEFEIGEEMQVAIVGEGSGGAGGSGGGPVSLTYSGATQETVPYLPNAKCTFKTGTSLADGLVMVDEKSNEWVWVEVPKSITASATTNEAIYTALDTYAHGTTESPIITKNVRFTDTWKNTDENTGASVTLSAVITEDKYNTNKEKMLKSIKANGGFWVGRYEAGIADGRYRTEKTDSTKPATAISNYTAVIQQNVKPYTYVTCKEAEELAEGLKPAGTNTASLMYGIQWDLVLRYLFEKTATTELSLEDINTNSKSWGNYSDSTIKLDRGQKSEDYGATYENVTVGNKTATMLLTTGASDDAKKMNIYDIAGNMLEWTLERGYSAYCQCVDRGGFYNWKGDYPAAFHDESSTQTVEWSFRPSLY